jgi:hypothetical protein
MLLCLTIRLLKPFIHEIMFRFFLFDLFVGLIYFSFEINSLVLNIHILCFLFTWLTKRTYCSKRSFIRDARTLLTNCARIRYAMLNRA